MARFLMTAWPVFGHVYPQVAIALALRERGHECVFYTGSRLAGAVTGEGFEHIPYQSLDEQSIQELLFGGDRDHGQHPGGMGKFTELLDKWMLQTLPAQVADLERILEDRRPDVICTDPSFWGPILIVGEKHEVPVAITSFMPACMIPGPDAPPFGLGLPKPRNLPTRLLSGMVSLGQKLFAKRFPREASRLRAEHGLPPLAGTILEHYAQVGLYLMPGSPEFDYDRRGLPPCCRYVGPWVWNRPGGAPPPDWLEELPRDQPLVHVTEGTVHVTEPFLLRAAVAGLSGRPMHVVLTTGSDRQPEGLNLGEPGANIHVAQWISHSDLLPRCDLFVTTGGAGSVMASLALGVPLICVPTEWDKPEIAQRVVESGAGLRLAPGRCTPQKLRAAVERVLGDPSFRENARRLAESFSQYGGAGQAADLLGELAAQPQGSQQTGRPQ